MRVLHERPPDVVSDDVIRRYVDEIDLTEVSILTVEPALVATTVETRAMSDDVTVLPDYSAKIKYIEIEKERIKL